MTRIYAMSNTQLYLGKKHWAPERYLTKKWIISWWQTVIYTALLTYTVGEQFDSRIHGNCFRNYFYTGLRDALRGKIPLFWAPQKRQSLASPRSSLPWREEWSIHANLITGKRKKEEEEEERESFLFLPAGEEVTRRKRRRIEEEEREPDKNTFFGF